MSKENELCPLCGAEPIPVYTHADGSFKAVTCGNPKCPFGSVMHIETWNHRTDSAQLSDLRAQNKDLQLLVDGGREANERLRAGLVKISNGPCLAYDGCLVDRFSCVCPKGIATKALAPPQSPHSERQSTNGGR
ncbi:hypothetical protein KAR91_50630 [Candidatus Pacearchaeota archaeon]|nr:hypothetical protein [Candidatus Pacearchaeota archaeon]